MSSPETGLGNRIDMVNTYIENSLDEISGIIETMQDEPPHKWDELDKLFLSFVR